MITTTSPEFDNLVRAACAAACDAGKAVLDVYASDFAVECKEDRTPVTLADRRAHEIIADRLASVQGHAFPVLSEEGKHTPYPERKFWEYFWLVDPLDGTREFIKRNGEFTVNIALIHRDRPVLGVIFVPMTSVLYYAVRGRGAYREAGGRAEQLPLPGTGRRYTIVASRSHPSLRQAVFVDAVKAGQGELDVISAGSSLKFCLVAEGKADVYPRFGPTMEWDTAAGQAIVEATGGRVVTIEGEPLRYNRENLVNPPFIVHGRSEIRRSPAP